MFLSVVGVYEPRIADTNTILGQNLKTKDTAVHMNASRIRLYKLYILQNVLN